MATTEDDITNIQLISFSAKLHSPNSDNSGPDSAFEDMQSSMTSSDPLSNTIEEFVHEEYVSPAKIDVTESAQRRRSVEDITREARKFQLALDGAKRKNGDILSPPGPKDFMARAQQFAEFVEKPPKMTVKKKRDIQTADDLTDEKCLEMEAERRSVISSSTMRKRDIDITQFVQDQKQGKFVCLIRGFRSQSTTMVMSNGSVNLTTLFLGRLLKHLTSTKCTSFYQ